MKTYKMRKSFTWRKFEYENLNLVPGVQLIVQKSYIIIKNKERNTQLRLKHFLNNFSLFLSHSQLIRSKLCQLKSKILDKCWSNNLFKCTSYKISFS